MDMSLEMQENEIKFSKPISHELLEEMLLDLAVKNQERIQTCKNGEYLWSSDITEFVFNICAELNLKRSVKYLALEIYERFMAKHIVDVHQKHSETLTLKSNKRTNWEVIQSRIKEQSVLRILTSVQLASKLESHYNHVMPRQVSEILEKAGRAYFTLNGLFSSELRVMKTLNYEINLTTPALYLEMLLYILFVNDPTVDECMYESAMNVLDFVYLHRTELYNALYEALAGESREEERDFNPVFLKVKADYMLLATAIIASTAYLLANKRYEVILEQMYQITRLMKKDIRNFSIIIAYTVLNDISD